MRLLIAEDDPFQREAMRLMLVPYYQVDTVEDGYEAYNHIQLDLYDLLILDLNMPKLDGIALCRRLRAEQRSLPIIIVTAAGAVDQRVAGLRAGADDYLSKPVYMEELLARVQALLRRSSTTSTMHEVLKCGQLVLDPLQRTASFNGRTIELTPREFILLELLMRHLQRTFSRSELINRLWSLDTHTQESSVKAHIKGLRRKLEEAGTQQFVQTVYGVGYRLINP